MGPKAGVPGIIMGTMIGVDDCWLLLCADCCWDAVLCWCENDDADAGCMCWKICCDDLLYSCGCLCWWKLDLACDLNDVFLLISGDKGDSSICSLLSESKDIVERLGRSRPKLLSTLVAIKSGEIKVLVVCCCCCSSSSSTMAFSSWKKDPVDESDDMEFLCEHTACAPSLVRLIMVR